MRRRIALATAVAASATSLAFSSATTADPTEVTSQTVVNPVDGTEIAISVYRPSGASAEQPVPVLLSSHGWAGTRQTDPNAFAAEVEAGFGVVTIDQRGHGESGGLAAGMDPEKEGQDLVAVLDRVASFDWVLREETPTPTPFDDRGGDIVVGSFGGSYGGAYQFTVALTELRDFGATRMDALAPDITWNDLNQSFGPNKVPRTAWLTALLAGAHASGTGMEDYIPNSYAFAAATGQYPDGTQPVVYDVYEEFTTHGPSGYRDADGDQLQLDIPVLLTQGFSDNLFPFNEAWRNWTTVLTDEAREQSTLVGYNGGHALPNVAPLGYPAAGGNACGGTSTEDRIAFFRAALLNDGDTRVLGPQPFHYTTASGDCLQLDESDLDFAATYAPLQVDPTGTTGPATGTVTVAGAPLSLPLAEGPLTIAGMPTLSADVYAAGYDQRVFLALAKGTTPADAQVIQNNMQPLRVVGPTPSTGERITIELVGVAESIAEGETLFLMISPTSDMFATMSSRTPGAVGLANVEVTIPTVIADWMP